MATGSNEEEFVTCGICISEYNEDMKKPKLLVFSYGVPLLSAGKTSKFKCSCVLLITVVKPLEKNEKRKRVFFWTESSHVLFVVKIHFLVALQKKKTSK